ncbi:HAMP domain-containing histidine kinase, partial [Candidatus Gracilibacteria bacterium]|nr:HAMP domain-containing histidine kinase [Candidatus Gracilibacteria bacterium]
KKYILQKDTIIIPYNGDELACSEGVANKLHNNMEILEEVKDSLFYKTDGKIYLIFSRKYEDIGEVKVLFDTTPYIKSQIIIIKISLIFIVLFSLLHFLGGRIISKHALKNLRKISNFAGEIDLDKKLKKIKIIAPKNDEIKIVASALNNSFSKIKKQSKNQKQFITDVSHEFKTPLMVINSKIDLYNKKCDKGVCGVDDINTLLGEIKGNTKKLNELLETLFMISRFGDGIVQFNKTKTDISHLVENIAEDLVQNSQKNIILDTKISRKITKDIEASTFTILLENLLTNAIKFSREGDIIEVRLDNKKMTIIDNGAGIDKNDLEKIFEKFYRTDENIEGFGVGLFIVQRILNLYNWKIEVKSELGKGSKFIIKF